MVRPGTMSSMPSDSARPSATPTVPSREARTSSRLRGPARPVGYSATRTVGSGANPRNHNHDATQAANVRPGSGSDHTAQPWARPARPLATATPIRTQPTGLRGRARAT